MFYILWGTIRPEMFISTHKYWMEKSTNQENIKTKVAVNTEEHKSVLMEYVRFLDSEVLTEEDIQVIGDERIGIAYASYCLTSKLNADKNDIIIHATDDFFPPQAWDDYLTEKFQDFSGCLLVRDGFQDFNKNESVPIAIPIMTFECLEKLNKIIYHPAYKHMFSDSELYDNLKEMGLIKDVRACDATTFEHRHYAVNKRSFDTFDSKYNSYWAEDAETYERRRRLSLEEKLKV